MIWKLKLSKSKFRVFAFCFDQIWRFKLHVIGNTLNTQSLHWNDDVCKFNMCLDASEYDIGGQTIPAFHIIFQPKCVLHTLLCRFKWATHVTNCRKLPTCLNKYEHHKLCAGGEKKIAWVKFYLKIFSHRFLMGLFNKHIIKSVVQILNYCSNNSR